MRKQSNMIEPLEDRWLLSAAISVVNGTLIVRGTQRADHIVVSKLAPGGSTPALSFAPLYVTVNGRTRLLDSAGIRQVLVEAGKGDDHVEMSDDPYFLGTQVAMLFIEQSLPATILGGLGNDTLIGGEGKDSISGGAGNDMLAGAIGDDIVEGDHGNDTIAGNAGSDLLRGGDGHDRILADDAGDSICGGGGFDVMLSPTRTPQTQVGLEAIAAAATLNELPEFGFARGVLTIFGTRRSDEIVMSSQFNTNPIAFAFEVNGRLVRGVDSSVIQKVVVLAGAGDDTVRAGPESGFSPIPEFVPFTLPLQVDGDFGNDTIIGGSGNDSLNGGQDDDQIAGAPGNDIINGGIGNDTIRGNDGDDSILGRDGNDSIDGGAGNDTVIGDDGTDTIFGGAGADHFESPTDNASEWKDKDNTDVVDPAPPPVFFN